MAMVVQELVTGDPEVKEALADAPEVIQEVFQTGPNTFHRVAVHTSAIRIVAGILTCSMVDGAMLVSSLRGEVVDVVLVGEKLGTNLDPGGDDGLNRVGLHIPGDFPLALSWGSLLVVFVAALNQAQDRWTAFLRCSPSSQFNATSPGFASTLLDLTGQTLAARTLIGFICFDLALQLALRIQMIRLVDPTV